MSKIVTKLKQISVNNKNTSLKRNAKMAKISMRCNGKNVDKSMTTFLESFEYVDVASGDSDTISMQFSDACYKFVDKWFPEDGDRFEPTIVRKNWGTTKKAKLKCGTFYLDDFSLSGEPTKCSMNAIAIPQQDGFHVTARNTTWKKTTLEKITMKIAERNQMTYVYDGFEVAIGELEQSGKDDCSFLCNLCDTYGLSMKLYAGKIIIFDAEAYKKKKSVTTIKRKNCNPSWYYRGKTVRYDKVILSYSSPDSKKEMKVTVGDGTKVYNTSASCENQADAILKANAALIKANKDTKVMTLSLPANRSIYATNVIKLTGFYQMSGKYYVEKVVHSLSGSAYIMKLTLSKID